MTARNDGDQTRSVKDSLASLLHGQVAQGRVAQAKSAPELERHGPSVTKSHQLKQRLPSDGSYCSLGCHFLFHRASPTTAQSVAATAGSCVASRGRRQAARTARAPGARALEAPLRGRSVAHAADLAHPCTRPQEAAPVSVAARVRHGGQMVLEPDRQQGKMALRVRLPHASRLTPGSSAESYLLAVTRQISSLPGETQVAVRPGLAHGPKGWGARGPEREPRRCGCRTTVLTSTG